MEDRPGVGEICSPKKYYSYVDRIVLKVIRKVSVLTSRNLHELPKLAAMIAIAPTFGIWKPQLSCVHKQWLDLTSYGMNVRLDKPSFFGSFNNTFDLSGNFMINLDVQHTTAKVI